VASSPSRSCAAAVTQGLRRARHGLVPLTTWCQGLACRGEPCSTRPGGTSLVSLPRIAQGAAAVDSQQAELLVTYAPETVLPGGLSGTPQHCLNYVLCPRGSSSALRTVCLRRNNPGRHKPESRALDVRIDVDPLALKSFESRPPTTVGETRRRSRSLAGLRRTRARSRRTHRGRTSAPVGDLREDNECGEQSANKCEDAAQFRALM